MADIAEDALWLDQLSKFLDEGRASFSLNQLRILKAISHADDVDIDPEVYTFTFIFGNYSLRGDPWNLVTIKPIPAGAKVIEYLPGSNGILESKHSPDANDKDRLIVQKATRLVWGQLMLGAFGRAVSMGEIVLYARTPTLVAHFEQLPADLWAELEIANWDIGAAVTHDGKPYWSIYASLPDEPVTLNVQVPAAPPNRARGPKPRKQAAVVQAMIADIRRGRHTLISLVDMIEKELAETYSVSRDTARKARNQVVTELSTTTNSNK